MLNDLIHQHTILDVSLDLLRDRALLGVLISTFLGREVKVDIAALASENLGSKTLLTKVDRGTIDLVQQDSRDDTIDLQSELGRLDDVEATHEGVDDDRQAITVVNGNGIGLAVDLDDALVTAGDEDRLVLLRGHLNNFIRAFKILD